MDTAENKGIFNSPYGQIKDSFNVLYGQKPPPKDHPNAIVCEQCEGVTWRLTDLCIHCAFDMYAYTQELIRLENLEQLKFEQQKLKQKILPLLFLMLALAAGGAFTAFYLAAKHPFMSWILISLMVIVAIVVKPLSVKLENIRDQIRELE